MSSFNETSRFSWFDRRRALSCALMCAGVLAVGGGCLSTPEDPGWKLVGAYDATALLATTEAAEDEGELPDYVWTPFPGMTSSCGPAKAPDGLGVFEAEALANSLTPTLAVVLERTEAAGEGPLSTAGVRVALGLEKPEFLLQPAVLPRYITVRVGGEGNVHHKQLVRTQLQMETCMEHKTGRGWVGGTASNLRQAFLLDPPDEENWGSDRMYFGGQRNPIPPLLGPPDACIVEGEELGVSGGGGAGEGSLDLVPSDVWGASLRSCAVEERPGAPMMRRPGMVPLRISGLGDLPIRRPNPYWSDLAVLVEPHDSALWKAANPTNTDESVRVDVLWSDPSGQGVTLLEQYPLFDRPEGGDGEGWSAGAGMTDLLARVPYYYPSVGMPEDDGRYVLLLVPNWQIVEGLRRLFSEERHPDRPKATAGAGVQYGVGWVLEHPEYLFVQVPDPESEEVADKEELEDETWLDLTEIMGGGTGGLRNWGYTVGMLSGRKPIALPAKDSPVWKQASLAQRAKHQSLFLGGVAVLAFFLLVGLRRLPDLWTRIPEERVDYWPGVPVDEDEESGGGKPPEGGEGGGGGDKKEGG